MCKSCAAGEGRINHYSPPKGSFLTMSTRNAHYILYNMEERGRAIKKKNYNPSSPGNVYFTNSYAKGTSFHCTL